MPFGCVVVGQGRATDVPGVVLAEVEPPAGLDEVEPLAELVVEPLDGVPELVVELIPGVVDDEDVEGVVLLEVLPEDDVLSPVALAFGNGSHGTDPLWVACGTGVAVLAGGVAVCGVGEAVCAGGVAVCGLGEAVCAVGVAVWAPEVAVCLAPADKAVRAMVPMSRESRAFMEASIEID